MSASTLPERIGALLDEIHDPCSVATGDALGLDEMGLVRAVEVGDDGDVHVHIRLTSPTCVMVGFLRTEIHDRVALLPGVRSVEVDFDGGFDWGPELMSAAVRRRRAERFAAAARGPHARPPSSGGGC